MSLITIKNHSEEVVKAFDSDGEEVHILPQEERSFDINPSLTITLTVTEGEDNNG